MPTTYPPEAIEDGLRLYLKFNGQNHAQIEKEMRKTWPGWSRHNLDTRGKKIGWVEKYGWKEALKLHLARKPASILNSAEQLVFEIEDIRKRLYAALKSVGSKADRDLVYQHRDYAKLSLDALTRVEMARDTLGGFVAMGEMLMEWLPEMGKDGVAAVKALLKVWDKIIDKATAEYGNQETAPNNGSQS